jgi:hypothetical protein
MAGEAEAPGGREPSDGRRRVAAIASHVRADRTGVCRNDGVGTVTGDAGAISIVMVLVTATARGRGVDRGHLQRDTMTGFAWLLSVASVRERDRARSGGVRRHADLQVRCQSIGHPGRLVTLVASLPGPHLVVADLTPPRGHEGQLLAGGGQMAGQAGHLDVSAVGKAVARRLGGTDPTGSLPAGRGFARDRAQQDGPKEQAPEGVSPPGPAADQREPIHDGR